MGAGRAGVIIGAVMMTWTKPATANGIAKAATVGRTDRAMAVPAAVAAPSPPHTVAAAATAVSSTSAPERRIDPFDGRAYTFEELNAFYKHTYNKKEIEQYWNQNCKPNKQG